MNAITAMSRPCRTVEEWLATHTVTRCPTMYALGISGAELQSGTVALEGRPWAEVIRQQNGNEVAAWKRKASKIACASEKNRQIAKHTTTRRLRSTGHLGS